MNICLVMALLKDFKNNRYIRKSISTIQIPITITQTPKKQKLPKKSKFQIISIIISRYSPFLTPSNHNKFHPLYPSQQIPPVDTPHLYYLQPSLSISISTYLSHIFGTTDENHLLSLLSIYYQEGYCMLCFCELLYDTHCLHRNV